MERFIIEKMSTVPGMPVQYYFKGEDSTIFLNEAIGKNVSIKHTGRIQCLWCRSNTPKSFAQGYCYQCYSTCPETEACVLKPDLCQIQWGKARDIHWAKEHHLDKHVVYLAFTGNLKIGVTRLKQVPTRWIDQGASMAIPVLELPNRYIAGLVEKFLMKHYSDKTNWRDMLMFKSDNFDLFAESVRVIEILNPEFKQYEIIQRETYFIKYPIEQYPVNPVQLSVETNKTISKLLVGIKGQYLMFDDDSVLNVRKYGGYEIEFHF